MHEPLQLIAGGFELLLVLLGVALAWRIRFSPEARLASPTPRLRRWNIQPSEFLIFILHGLVGGFFGSLIATAAARILSVGGDKLMIVATAGLHLGILVGVLGFHATHRGSLAARIGQASVVLRSGVATFLIALPFVFLTGLAWAGAMRLAGLPVENQPAVELFKRLGSPLWIGIMAATAGLIAPMTEETIFRLGLFRLLRTRLPRWAALLLPAFLFAATHQDLNTLAQLTTLGIVFSLAYERTGRIGTTMVAHALFNFNAILLVLSGVAA